MAVTFLKRSTLPVSAKGKVGTLNVGISEAGQFVLSTLATKALNGSKQLVLGFDSGKVYLFKGDAKVVAKVEEKDKIVLRFPKPSKKDGKIKSNQAYFAGADILKDRATFGEHVYDYKASGPQSFAATYVEKNECLVFDLPKGAIAKRPVVKRVKKPKPATGISAVPGAIAGTPVGTTVAEDELVLETA